jgi:hypothetical protein
MRISKYFMIGTLIMSGIIPSIGQSKIIIDSSIHETIPLQSSDRLDEILKLADIYFHSDQVVEQNEKNYNLEVTAAGTVLSVKKAHRDYTASVSKKEKQDISHIITSLANKALTTLWSEKSDLKKVGDRIDHLHPLRFLGIIFTNEELKAGIHGIRDRGWVWDEFSTGLYDNLAKESNANNLTDAQISDFAKRINIEVGMIQPSLQNRQWKQFINTLIDKVPRQATDRYKI